MNQRDIKLMRAIVREIGDIGVGERILFRVSYSRIVQINLIILKILLDEWLKQGIFITVDRPHSYMEHLLKMHRVENRHRLRYIDAIGNYSGDSQTPDNSGVVNHTPFQIETLPDELIKGIMSDQTVIDMRNNDFILIDNLAAMLNYNSLQSVVEFVDRYLKAIALYDSIFTALFIDSRNHPELYDAIKPFCDIELEITADMGVKKRGFDDDSDAVIRINDEKKRIIRSILMFSPGKVRKEIGKPDMSS